LWGRNRAACTSSLMRLIMRRKPSTGAAMTAVWALVRPKIFALYIAFAVVGALLAGYAYAVVLAAF
jgi:hypothetical protein